MTLSLAETLIPPFLPERRYAEGDALDLGQPLAFTVEGLMGLEECAATIARMEALGCKPAPVTTGRGFVMMPEVRNNTRVIFDDPVLADALYSRVEAVLPRSMCGGRRPVGLNERFRAYRYEPGQRFAPHYDGAYARNAREASLLTMLVYLNDDFEGGETAFLDFERRVRPAPGRALLFQHALLHEGALVTRGVKYALRTDVMFRSPELSASRT